MRTICITINDELYLNLKHSVSSRQMSKFVCEAVREKLTKEEELYQAYLEASQDEEIEKELKEWDAIAFEGWEED
jgi:predicted CopG family antitoxin